MRKIPNNVTFETGPRERGNGTSKQSKNTCKNSGKPSADQEKEHPDAKQRSLEKFFLKRKRVDWVGKQTSDDDMFMFVICNLRSTIHDTPARNAVLSTTQADDRPIIDFVSDVSTCQRSLASKIQVVEPVQTLSLLSVLDKPL